MSFLEDAGQVLIGLGRDVATAYAQGVIARKNAPRKRDTAGPTQFLPSYVAQGYGAGSLTQSFPGMNMPVVIGGDAPYQVNIPPTLPLPSGQGQTGGGSAVVPYTGGECSQIFTRVLPNGRVTVLRDIIANGPRGPIYYRNRGRPLLFSGDMSFLKDVNRVGRKFARKAGIRSRPRRRRSR
jgi:hypothetical protein